MPCAADVRVVLHVHSVYSVALACLKDLDYACAAPVYTAGYAGRIGNLTTLPYFESGSAALADGVKQVIAQRNSVLLANHGLLTVGASYEQALNLVEEVEANAQLFFILRDQGRSLDEAKSGMRA